MFEGKYGPGSDNENFSDSTSNFSRSRCPEVEFIDIPEASDSRYTAHLIGHSLNVFGLEIRPALDSHIPYMSPGGVGFSKYSISKCSNELFDRIHGIEDLREENKQLKEKIKKLEDSQPKTKIDRCKAAAHGITNEDIIRTHEKFKRAKLDAHASTSPEIENPNRGLSYEEKIQWFCNEYDENLEIILEAFKHDDLSRFYWKGKKVNFPNILSDLRNKKGEDEKS